MGKSSKVKLAAETARDVLIGLIKDGKLLSDRKYAQERLLVCASCQRLNPENYVCDVCGCNMKVKTRILRARCPDKPRRW